MEDYRELGSRYLTTNKKRSLITVIGCFIVAAGLFMFLNCMACWVEKCRIDARADDDCEIIILTDDKDIIEKIVNEAFVTSAYLGKAYSWQNDDAEEIYANALHINVKEKFLINYYSKYIKKTYGVETELNELLSWTYCQDNEGIGYLMILFGLLISLVLAIIGVGVLRNNISISAMERVKDYGNLRCIGATKKQIKQIVYRESFFLETVGIAGGIFAGFLLSIPVCTSPKREYPIGFHILPVILLLIAFYGDMYFAVNDGLKKVLSVSPSEAVRGNYRIKAKRIKRRRSGIWGRIFGVEGDYAYKNIKRNNGRFIKTVTAMVFGMIIVIVVGGVLGKVYQFYDEVANEYGYYQQYIYRDTSSAESYDEMKADLYSPEALKRISSSDGISKTKFLYQSTLYAAEDRWVFKNINNAYNKETYDGQSYGMGEETSEQTKLYRGQGSGLIDYAGMETYDEKRNSYNVRFDTYYSIYDTMIYMYGYDKEDYGRCADNLVEGTMDLSENGILLVNQANLTPSSYYEEYDGIVTSTKPYQFLDVNVGDEITVVDPVELYNLVQEERKNAKAYDEYMHKEADRWNQENKGKTGKNGEPLVNPYEQYIDIENNDRKELWIVEAAREKLVEEGKCKKYVIEGILERDPNNSTVSPAIIVPLDKFYRITGKTESDYNGIKFHVSNIFSRDFEKNDFLNALNEKTNNYYIGEEYDGPVYESYTSPFLEGMGMVVSGVKYMIGAVVIIFIFIIISILNTLNVTISGLQLRRNEFAQLRSLGMTKRSLLKAVLLEGGIVWIVSTIIGIILGIAIEYVLYKMFINLIIDSGIYIFWPGIIIAALLSLVVLAGSNYFFFKQMKLDVASELIRSGE